MFLSAKLRILVKKTMLWVCFFILYALFTYNLVVKRMERMSKCSVFRKKSDVIDICGRANGKERWLQCGRAACRIAQLCSATVKKTKQ